MPEFVRVKLMQVDFGAQSPARDPYCAVSIKEAIADAGKLTIHIMKMIWTLSFFVFFLPSSSWIPPSKSVRMSQFRSSVSRSFT